MKGRGCYLFYCQVYHKRCLAIPAPLPGQGRCTLGHNDGTMFNTGYGHGGGGARNVAMALFMGRGRCGMKPWYWSSWGGGVSCGRIGYMWANC